VAYKGSWKPIIRLSSKEDRVGSIFVKAGEFEIGKDVIEKVHRRMLKPVEVIHVGRSVVDQG